MDKYVVRNSHGFRDNEYPYKKPNDTFRILVLDDSQTFGHGIKDIKDTWHKKLEVLMNQGLENHKFQVISLAGKGWNTDTQLYELLKVGFKYNPNMILIGFYMNDMPRLKTMTHCQQFDIKLFKKSYTIKWFRENSKVYHFIEFRVNRLLEKLGYKPTYADCRNQTFNSRGWDISKISLDTIQMSAQIKNIHFMLTTIPLLFKLGNNYPLKNDHLKIKTCCEKRKLECLDLFNKSFKRLDHTQLVVSNTDAHLNELGTEIVAETLFERLKMLKIYKHLTRFHGAFSLKELLDAKPMIIKFDERFLTLDKNIFLAEAFDKKFSFTAKTKNELLSIKKVIIEDNNKFIINFVLRGDGTFKEKNLLVLKDKKKIYEETIRNKIPIEIIKTLAKSNFSFYFKNSVCFFYFQVIFDICL